MATTIRKVDAKANRAKAEATTTKNNNKKTKENADRAEAAVSHPAGRRGRPQSVGRETAAVFFLLLLLLLLLLRRRFVEKSQQILSQSTDG